MRRILATVVLLAALGAFVLLAGGAGQGAEKQPTYWIELDNAFGLVPGSDFKIAGVGRVGKVTEEKVDQRTHKALIGVKLTQSGFSPIKTDVSCETRPQSLIGEYFIDCNPGRNRTVLKPGSVVPVTRTFSTIPADLVNNVLRLPQRQRLRIILNELGVGLAGRGGDLNAVIRRAVPALRETDRLLALLADESRTITDLTVNADTVVSALADNRKQVSRWVREARDTSRDSADRRVALARTWHLLPAFLEQLRPTMRSLGQTADEQIPTLRDLDAASGNLKRFLVDVRPFSEASKPSLRTLGETSNVGRQAIPPLQKTVSQLAEFSSNAPELGKNLRIVLEDLDDRNRAVERDPRTPGGAGLNGFEALLRYTWAQSQAINIFDRNSYILKVALIQLEDLNNSRCGPYRDAKSVKDSSDLREHCASWLGPDQPGITTHDPSPTGEGNGNNSDPNPETDPGHQSHENDQAQAAVVGQAAASALRPAGQGTQASAPATTGQPPVDVAKSLQRLVGSGAQGAPQAAAAPDRDQGTAELLDYLFAP
ncbi:MAG: MlaD family protein [Solirubrobacteraceae bacterium]